MSQEVYDCFDEYELIDISAMNEFDRHIEQSELREGGIPFRITTEIPNRDTIAAMMEAERIANDSSVKGYTDLDELIADLNA